MALDTNYGNCVKYCKQLRAFVLRFSWLELYKFDLALSNVSSELQPSGLTLVNSEHLKAAHPQKPKLYLISRCSAKIISCSASSFATHTVRTELSYAKL
jgi:hypothetical protein